MSEAEIKRLLRRGRKLRMRVRKQLAPLLQIPTNAWSLRLEEETT